MILMVLSYANQIVLKHCQAIDPQGKRTLGIITKPDSLTEGTANQKAWLELAQNRDIYFQLGWHMVKNRSELEGDKSFVQRNQSERQFFSRGAYAELPNDCKGIETLRSRLSSLLHDHLKNELPLLKAELVEKLQATSKDLGQLGVKRSTTVEQRLFLTDIGQNINSLLQSAIQGQYYSSFFETVNMKAAVDHVDNIRRFRAVIQHLNLSFSDRMHRVGHKYAIPSSKGNAIGSYNDDDDVLPADIPAPIKMSRDEAIDWVHRTLERSRGCELPGSFNPLIISQLFWDQSKKWNELILQHIDKVFESCKTFVRVVLEEAAPSDIRQRLSDLCIDAALEKSLKDAKEELEKVMEDKGRHPMTYNHVSLLLAQFILTNVRVLDIDYDSSSPPRFRTSANLNMPKSSPTSPKRHKSHFTPTMIMTPPPPRCILTQPNLIPNSLLASSRTWISSPRRTHLTRNLHTTRTSSSSQSTSLRSRSSSAISSILWAPRCCLRVSLQG